MQLCKQPQPQTGLSCKGRAHAHTCTSVRSRTHACLPAYLSVWTEAGRIEPSLISFPASNQLTCSLRDNDGQTAVPACPCPSPTPPHPPLTSSARTDPLSVRCSQDQQPRQYPFHHSGPQCLFHKLSQALGLKGCIATGFGLCKHANARGWQVGAQCASPPPPAPKRPLHSEYQHQ